MTIELTKEEAELLAGIIESVPIQGNLKDITVLANKLTGISAKVAGVISLMKIAEDIAKDEQIKNDQEIDSAQADDAIPAAEQV